MVVIIRVNFALMNSFLFTKNEVVLTAIYGYLTVRTYEFVGPYT